MKLPNLISAFEAVVSADHAMVSDWVGFYLLPFGLILNLVMAREVHSALD